MFRVAAPEFLIPAGDWAEWVGSVLAGGSLIGLVVGLHRERRARRTDESERRAERRRAQARRIAVWTESAGGSAPPPRTGVRSHIVNTSDEPVYTSVVWSAIDYPGAEVTVDEWSVGTLPPHTERTHEATFSVADRSDIAVSGERTLIAELLFTDASGVSWARLHFGLLVERSDPLWADRVDLSTIERSRQLRHIWETQLHGVVLN